MTFPFNNYEREGQTLLIFTDTEAQSQLPDKVWLGEESSDQLFFFWVSTFLNSNTKTKTGIRGEWL